MSCRVVTLAYTETQFGSELIATRVGTEITTNHCSETCGGVASSQGHSTVDAVKETVAQRSSDSLASTVGSAMFQSRKN